MSSGPDSMAAVPDSPGPSPRKTPAIVVWALILSILGLCGITAVIGLILGMVGRGQAKKAGAGVGMATAAIIIGAAWIAVFAIGGIVSAASGSKDSTATAPTAASSSQASSSEAPVSEAPASDAVATEPPASDAPTSDAAASEAPAAGGIGIPVRDGKFEFTVTKVKCGVSKVGDEFFNKEAQGQFCLVTMSVQNIGDESQMFDAGSQKAQTSTGATVDASTEASLYANDSSDSFLAEINPGNSLKEVVVVYDIAPDQTLSSLELHDSIFSGGVTVTLG